MAASVLTTLERMTQSFGNPVVGGEILLGGLLGCPQGLLVVVGVNGGDFCLLYGVLF